MTLVSADRSNARETLGADALSYSEQSLLGQCETRWHYAYAGEREDGAATQAMQLGSEFGRLWGSWWTVGVIPRTEDEHALWLMRRYAEHYVANSWDVSISNLELPLVAKLPRGPMFFGFADGLLLDGRTGELWIAELKTTDKLSAVQYLTESNQMPLYVWAARKMGYPVVGAMLDVVRTFRPVKKELPLSESFDRRWLRDDDPESPEYLNIPRALGEARSAVRVRRELLAGSRAPMRSVGPSCSWCPFAAPCQGLSVTILDEDPEQGETL